jgi:hypothetical protein
VFFGVLLAFIAIKTPGWVSDSLAESRKDEARSILLHLTPKQLVSACGAPQQDELDQIDRDLYDRRMRYGFYDFEFLTNLGEGFSPQLKDNWDRWSSHGVWDSGKLADSQSVIFRVPCLRRASP